MASTQALSTVAQDRKARLAQLKSLKRKQPDGANETNETNHDSTRPLNSPRGDGEDDESPEVKKYPYLSGRNYDAETKGPRLGFEAAPSEGQETLERKAAILAAQTKQQAEAEEKHEKPLDLFKLQPKKPNWDLKRDLDRKLDILNVRTDNAIARLVRERISNQQKAVGVKGGSTTNGEPVQDGEAVGIEGASLVEATNVREREDEEEARREKEEEAALLGEEP